MRVQKSKVSFENLRIRFENLRVPFDSRNERDSFFLARQKRMFAISG